MSTNGTTTCVNAMPSNWVSRLWPSISAVMPVPSETKNTVRLRLGIEAVRRNAPAAIGARCAPTIRHAHAGRMRRDGGRTGRYLDASPQCLR